MNYLDILFIIVILLAMKVGYSRGIIFLLGGLAGKIVSFLFAVYFSRPFAIWVGTNFGITDWLTAKLLGFFPPAGSLAGADMGRIGAQELPQALDALGLPPLLKMKVMEQVPTLVTGGSASVTAIMQELAAQTGLLLLQAVSFLVLLVVGGILLKLIIATVDHVLAGTVVGTLNRLLGMVLSLSLTLAMMIMIIGFTAPLILVPAGGEAHSLSTLVQGSWLYPRFLESYGLLLGAIISGQ